MYGVFIVQDGDVMMFSTTGDIEDARKEMQDAIESGHTTVFVLKLEDVREV